MIIKILQYKLLLENINKLNITNDIKDKVCKYDTYVDFMKSGGLDIEVLDRLAFGFADNDIKTLMPNELKIKWKLDLENVMYEIQHSGLSKIEWAKKINITEPIDVSYSMYNNKLAFYIEDGHHRYMAAKILNKPLNVNLEIKYSPVKYIDKNIGYDELMLYIYNKCKNIK